MTLLLWQLGGLVLAVISVVVVRELTRPRPLYLSPIANTKPPVVTELAAVTTNDPLIIDLHRRADGWAWSIRDDTGRQSRWHSTDAGELFHLTDGHTWCPLARDFPAGRDAITEQTIVVYLAAHRDLWTRP